MDYLGAFFAFMTAISWAVSSIIFESASKKSDSITVNVVRLMMGIIILGIITLFSKGMFLPFDSNFHNWTFLGISGIIGLFFGDMFLYESYVLIGARIAMIFLPLTPLIVGTFGSFILGETPTLLQALGMLVTCSGILLVVIEPKSNKKTDEKKISMRGIVYIILAVSLEALGNVFTKLGAKNYDPNSSTQIRMMCALFVFIFYLTFKKRWKFIGKAFIDKNLLYLLFSGTLVSTIGIACLVSAFNRMNTGIASTISSISPIIIIPISIIVFKDKVKLKEIIGACISVSGIALFFL